MPEKEADHLTPATRLLEKKREMAEVEQALQATKDVCMCIYKPILDRLCNTVCIAWHGIYFGG